MKNSHNNFLKTDDDEQIFYSTNFKPGTITESVVIFNYGLVCSNFHYGEQIEFLESIGKPILIYDYRGHFQSSGIDNLENITFSRMAQDLSLIIDRLELESSILIGHSMGVNVCLEYARTNQAKISKMILISGTILPVQNILMNTHLSGPVIPLLEQALNMFPKEFKTFWKYGGWSPILKRMIRSGGFNPNQVGLDFIETYLNKLGELGPELFFQLINQMQTHDSLAFVEEIEVKSLIVGGNRDKVVPNFLQKLLHEKLVDSELYTIHSGSHVPQVDFPDLINERIQYFLEN
jgi:pimeloyl-ACP methyl ester carboxylesterase